MGFNPDCKTIFTVHTVNAWLKPKPAFDIKQIMRTIDTNLCSFIGPRFLLPKYDAINVVYPTLKEYVENETDYRKKVFALPFGFFDEENFEKIEGDKKIRFVITGQIEEHRRDYDIILNAFENIFPKYNKEIELILLGYPVGGYGARIIKRCKNLKEQGYNIKYFDGFVPEKEYNESLKKVDFIILPIKIKSKGMGVVAEYYGKTKGNAGIFEAIQYAKPMIIPADFNMVDELKSSTFFFKDPKNLEETIGKLIENKEEIKKLKQTAYNNSKHFSVNVLQSYFEKEILNKLDEL
jgi:hypothetical protein